MKNKTYPTIFFITIAILVAFLVVAILDNAAKSYEIARLEDKLEQQTSIRVTVTNDYWHYATTDDTLYGDIHFNDLSLLKSMDVTYKDEMFNTLTLESILAINYEENKATTSCLYDEITPTFAVVTLFYKDGHVEDVTLKICKG